MLHPTPQDYIRVPETMRHPTLKRWVLFRCTTLPSGKIHKVPLMPNGRAASIANPRTWSSFQDCLKMLPYYVGDALGFALGTDYKMIFVDLDDCIHYDDYGMRERMSPTVIKYLKFLAPSHPYVEESISGTGLHILAWYTGNKPPCNPEPGVEFYTENRFCVMTGTVFV